MEQIRHPFGFEHGRTATADRAAHVRQLIEMLLFTNPGERINRPDFGGGLRQLTFEPNSDSLAASLQAQAHSNLQHWLDDLIDVSSLDVRAEDERVVVTVAYSLRQTNQVFTESFERSAV